MALIGGEHPQALDLYVVEAGAYAMGYLAGDRDGTRGLPQPTEVVVLGVAYGAVRFVTREDWKRYGDHPHMIRDGRLAFMDHQGRVIDGPISSWMEHPLLEWHRIARRRK